MRVAIVMPTYNEALNIGKMIDTLGATVFSAIQGAEMHLVVVDDNSPDGTGDIVRGRMETFDRLHLLSGPKAGLGKAYVRGMQYAMQRLKAAAVIEMDADFQHAPADVPRLVQAFMQGADYVIGSRYLEAGGIPPQWAWYRRFISAGGNLVARRMLGLPHLHDLTTGFRLTRVDGVLAAIDLDGLMALDRFAFKVDLLYQTQALARRTVEIPIQFRERRHETSKFNLMEIAATLKVILLLRIRKTD